MYFLDMLFSKAQLFLYFFLRSTCLVRFKHVVQHINPLQYCYINTF